MSKKTGNWVVVQSIDLQERIIVIEMGIRDSFGAFHPEGDSYGVQKPGWLTMSQEDFIAAAELEMALMRNKQQSVA